MVPNITNTDTVATLITTRETINRAEVSLKFNPSSKTFLKRYDGKKLRTFETSGMF